MGAAASTANSQRGPQYRKIQKYMDTKLSLIPSANMELPKKVVAIQPLIEKLRGELEQILQDPTYDTSAFEGTKLELFKWFVNYVERCEKFCSDPKICNDLKEFLAYMTKMFEEVYAAQHKLAIGDYTEELGRYTKLVAQAQKQASENLLGKKMEQSTSKLLSLYNQAAGKESGILVKFHAFMKRVAHATLAAPYDGKHALKDVFRAVEKAAMRPGKADRFKFNNVYDVVRGALIYQNFPSITNAFQFILSCAEILVDQVKDRFSPGKHAGGGWCDLVLSCRFKDDRDGHVFEIQIHHAAFTSTRSTLGGHDVYAVFRCVLEALEVAGVDLSASEEAPQLAALRKMMTQAKSEKRWKDCKQIKVQIANVEKWLEQRDQLQQQFAAAEEVEDFDALESLTDDLEKIENKLRHAITMDSIVRHSSSVATAAPAAALTPAPTKHIPVAQVAYAAPAVAGSGHELTYAITTANDCPNRDPVKWRVFTRMSPEEAWQLVDDRSSRVQEVPRKRHTRTKFSFATPPTDLKYVRFVTVETRNPGEKCLQLATFDILDASGKRIDACNAKNPGGRSPGKEECGNAVDGQTRTKWLDFNKGALEFELAI